MSQGIRCTKEHAFPISVNKINEKWSIIEKSGLDISELIVSVEEKRNLKKEN